MKKTRLCLATLVLMMALAGQTFAGIMQGGKTTPDDQTTTSAANSDTTTSEDSALTVALIFLQSLISGV